MHRAIGDSLRIFSSRRQESGAKAKSNLNESLRTEAATMAFVSVAATSFGDVCHLAGTPPFSRAAARMSEGVAPKARRNERLKYDRSAKPQVEATALIGWRTWRGSASMRRARASR